MKAAAKDRWGSDSLKGQAVAVQGCGQRGYDLCRYLHEEGAKLIVTDIDAERSEAGVSEFGAEAVAPEEIYDVAGRRRRPLRARRHDQRRDVAAPQGRDHRRRGEQPAGRGPPRRRCCEQRGILYAPDYVINAGGVINVYGELHRWPPSGRA